MGMSGRDQEILCSSELSGVLLSTQPEQQTTANAGIVIMALPGVHGHASSISAFLLQTKVGFWHRPPWEWNRNVSQLCLLNPYVTYEVMYKLLQLSASSRV